MMDTGDDEIDKITAYYNRLNPEQLQQHIDKLKVEYNTYNQIKCYRYVEHDIDIDDLPIGIPEKMAARAKRFGDVGLAAIDIETFIDNSLEHSIFNMRPFVLHLYGKLQQRVMIQMTEKVTENGRV